MQVKSGIKYRDRAIARFNMGGIAHRVAPDEVERLFTGFQPIKLRPVQRHERFQLAQFPSRFKHFRQTGQGIGG